MREWAVRRLWSRPRFHLRSRCPDVAARLSRRTSRTLRSCLSSTLGFVHAREPPLFKAENRDPRPRLLLQWRIAVDVDPVGPLCRHVAGETVHLVIGRCRLQRIVRVEPRPSPAIAPQLIAGVATGAVLDHDEPTFE